MSRIIPWSALPPWGGSPRHPLAPLGDGLRRAYCEVLRSPAAAPFRGALIPGSVGRAARRVNGAAIDYICPDYPPLPENSELPFFGGQCDTLYDIVVRGRRPTGLTYGNRIDNVPGPLQQCYVQQIPTTAVNALLILNVRGADGILRTANILSGAVAGFGTYELEVSRADGGPDDCGDRPIPDPPPLPVPPVNVVVPVVIAGQLINAPVTIEGINIDVDGDVQFSPQFRFDGIPFRILPEGIQLDFDPQIQLAPDVDVSLDAGSVGGALGALLTLAPSVIDLLTEILDLVDQQCAPTDLTPLAEYIRCLIEKPDARIQSSSLVAASSGGSFPIDPRAFAVVINRLDPLAPETKIQSGSGGNPNVEFWGWTSTGNGSAWSERTPLNYQNTIVAIPPFSSHILINPTFNNRFTATELIEVNQCQFQS